MNYILMYGVKTLHRLYCEAVEKWKKSCDFCVPFRMNVDKLSVNPDVFAGKKKYHRSKPAFRAKHGKVLQK